MKRFLKLLVALAFLAGIATAGSYVGARAVAGQLVGTAPPLSQRDITFAFKGVEDLPDHPVAWVFTYGRNQIGVRRVAIFISPTGKLLGTVPRNLEERLRAWEEAQVQ